MLNPYLKDIQLSKNEYQKYARHLILDQIGINGQKRLKKSKILFIGAGGLACPAILYLTTSGVGNIGIIDHDHVSQSNLHRQILYTKENINQLKVHSAKTRIDYIEPKCQITVYPLKLTYDNSKNIIKNYDIVIDTCDNFETRYIIDDACYELHKTHIYGAIEQFEGQVSVFNYKSGPKYSDVYPAYLKLPNNNCNTTGVLGLLTGIIGLLQAIEAIKIILGIQEVLSGKILLYNLLNTSFKTIKIDTKKIKLKKKYKSTCDNLAKDLIPNIDLKYIHQNKNILLIDVRQNTEFKLSHITKAINIPLKYIKTKNVHIFLNNYCKYKTLVIYCNNDSRSITASQIMHKYKIKHYKLQQNFFSTD